MKQEKWSKFSTKVGRPRKVRYGLQFEVLRKQKLMRFLELWEAERFRHFGLGSWWEFCNTAGRCPSAPDAWIAFMLSFRLEQKGVIFIVLQRELWLMFHNLDLPFHLLSWFLLYLHVTTMNTIPRRSEYEG